MKSTDYIREKYHQKGKFPIWLEYHIEKMAHDYKTEEFFAKHRVKHAVADKKEKYKKELKKLQTEHEQKLVKELRNLDKFRNVLTGSEESHREAEERVYHFVDKFYKTCERLDKLPSRHKTESDLAKEEEKEKEAEEEEEQEDKVKTLANGFYAEKDLTARQRDFLQNSRYKRLKISPYGDSGAAYYWVKTRYNEGKEHAFFCYLIKTELKKYVKTISMNVNSGPDIEFERKKVRYCIDVETGKKLQREPEEVDWKYAKYKRRYGKILIFVTRRKMKKKYSYYGDVFARGKLKETIAALFNP
ncbi:MAG: hypothetical protein V1861_06925 [Candidatus Micrarchaeota archaeon]